MANLNKLCNWVLDELEAKLELNVENEDLSLETLRGRNLPSPARRRDSPGLVPPQRKDTARETVKAAATSAVNGYVRALEEQDPKMVAARTAQAIAVAASTSRTRAGFVAASTAVESAALLAVEDHRIQASYGRLKALTKHVINVAVDAALASDDTSAATGPSTFNSRDADGPEQRDLALFPELPLPSPTWSQPFEPEPPLWQDYMGVIALAFAVGFLIPFASGLEMERALLSGMAIAVLFGIILLRLCLFDT